MLIGNYQDKKLFSLILIFILLNFCVFSEITVGVYRLDSKNVNNQTQIAISNALYNFVSELEGYTVIDNRFLDLNTQEFKKFNYIFLGKLIGLNDGIRLELLLKNTAQNKDRAITKVYKNSNLILLDSRALVSDLFNSSVKLNANAKSSKTESQKDLSDDLIDITNLSLLSGSWKGEQGVERIEIMRGGRAIAVLSSGVSIFLQLKLSDGYLYIRQVSAPLPRQFLNLPDNIAKKAANLGKTPIWKFKASGNYKVLSGEKTDVEISYNETDITSSKEIQTVVSWHKQ